MFIETVPEDRADADVAAYYASQRAAWGFLPDYAGAFSLRPDVAAAWNQLNAAVRGGMDRRRFELVTVAAAQALGSTYCATAHAKFLREVCDDEPAVLALAEGGLDGADQLLCDFAVKVARDASSVTQADVDALRSAGLTDRDVADVVMAVAARAFFTKVLDGLGAQLDLQTAELFAPSLRAAFEVGRPPREVLSL